MIAFVNEITPQAVDVRIRSLPRHARWVIRSANERHLGGRCGYQFDGTTPCSVRSKFQAIKIMGQKCTYVGARLCMRHYRHFLKTGFQSAYSEIFAREEKKNR